MFFILTSLLLLVAVKQGRVKQMIFVYLLISISYGALLELMQAYCFSNRSADWKDIIANSFGCVMALLFLKKIRGLYMQSHKKSL